MVRSVVIIFVTWQENMAANHVLESSVKPFADSYLLSLCENNVDDVKGYGNHTVAHSSRVSTDILCKKEQTIVNTCYGTCKLQRRFAKIDDTPQNINCVFSMSFDIVCVVGVNSLFLLKIR